MAKRALTAAQGAALDAHGVHWIAPSLYMQVRPQGTRSWLFRYGRGGRNQWLGLGAVADKPLGAARDEAAELRGRVRRGADLAGERRERRSVAVVESRRAVPTFAECASRYIADHQAGWKNDKHVEQWKSTIRMYTNRVLGRMPVDTITVDHVLKVLKSIWTSKPETASRLRGRIEKVLGWATAMKHREGDNPAAWSGALSHLLPPLSRAQRIEHHKALPYKDVPALMDKLLRMESSSARALAFTILTVARTGETIGATAGEIDREHQLWVLPPGRMKAGREHRVPLTDTALRLLGASTPVGPDASVDAAAASRNYLFPGSRPDRPLSNMAMLMLLRDLCADGVTVHGFRSAFSTWAREQTDYPREIVEACLAHASGDAVELAYRMPKSRFSASQEYSRSPSDSRLPFASGEALTRKHVARARRPMLQMIESVIGALGHEPLPSSSAPPGVMKVAGDPIHS